MAILKQYNKTWSLDAEMGDGHRGWVYAIQASVGGPIKIGFAADPTVRLKKLQAMNPVELLVLGVARGSLGAERAMHEGLAAHRLHGEWFTDAADVRSAIAHFEPLDDAWFQSRRSEQRQAHKIAEKTYVRREIPPDPRRQPKPSRTRISYDLTPEQEEEQMARLRIVVRSLEV